MKVVPESAESMKREFVISGISATGLPNTTIREIPIAISLVAKTDSSLAGRDRGAAFSIERLLAGVGWQRVITRYNAQIEMSLRDYLESGINVGDTVEVELRRIQKEVQT